MAAKPFIELVSSLSRIFGFLTEVLSLYKARNKILSGIRAVRSIADFGLRIYMFCKRYEIFR